MAQAQRGAWWSVVFSSAFENDAFTDTSQLDSGRSLARREPDHDLEVEPGSATMRQSVVRTRHARSVVEDDPTDTRRRPWTAQLGVRALSDADWIRLIDEIATRPAVSAQLLTGSIPAEVAAIASDLGVPLQLGKGDLGPDCSCPDWHEPCKHVFALCARLVEMIEADPWLYLLLRGMDRQRFLDALREQREKRSGASAGPTSHEPRGADPGMAAAAAHRSSPGPIPGPHRRTPLVAGVPVALLQEPPLDSGVRAEDLQRLVADAAQRALGLLTDEAVSGLRLDPRDDAIRMVAAADGTTAALSARVCEVFNMDAEELTRAVAAWNVGGEPGLRAIDLTAAAPGALGDVAADLDGSVTQLRVDAQRRWWRFERDQAAGGSWILADGPFDRAHDAIG